MGAVAEVNAYHRVNTVSLGLPDKGKNGRSAVDVGQGKRIQFALLCLRYQLFHREGAVFEAVVRMAVEVHKLFIKSTFIR